MLRFINIVIGCFIVSFGVLVLQNSEIITGGTAGLALSISYSINISFAIAFFLVNIPFYILSVRKMGWKFTLSTFFAVSLLSIMTELLQFIPNFEVTPLFGAILGGSVIGIGVTVLFMNGASLGGANILALVLQKKLQINPGKTMFLFDFFVILIGLYSVGIVRGFYSVISIFFISIIISLMKGKFAVSKTESKIPSEAQASA
ncbi:YitT family protein [Evansella sp. AB-rgal1]|uniref:YitT family protein n=1 Tax=Evansella sp. AB-rgal1 TaxID=3242696 RepID=UPI00359DA946